VRQRGPSNPKVRRREVALIVLAAIAALLFIYPRASLTIVAEPQGRRTQNRRRPARPSPVRAGRDYSNFKHEDHQTGLKCANCHTITTQEKPDQIAAATRQNSLLSYPYHDSCLNCHRQQFYRGALPTICTVCHTRVSPRLTSRDVYPEFPNPKRGDIIAAEFPGFFPHEKHKDLKACADCHKADARGPITLPLKAIQSEETFKIIEKGTFKTVPGERGMGAHASCFECHWQENKPTKDDCNGCHLSPSDYKAGKNPITGSTLQIVHPRPLSPNAVKWFSTWPADLPKRFSLKFQHESGGHVSEACAKCHVNISQMTTLNIPKADVEISSCAKCHLSDNPIPVGTGDAVTLSDEMMKKAAPGQSYVCVACHTTPIGREPPPPSHYTAIKPPSPQPGPAGGAE
jgi:hypothetical protein